LPPIAPLGKEATPIALPMTIDRLSKYQEAAVKKTYIISFKPSLPNFPSVTAWGVLLQNLIEELLGQTEAWEVRGLAVTTQIGT